MEAAEQVRNNCVSDVSETVKSVRLAVMLSSLLRDIAAPVSSLISVLAQTCRPNVSSLFSDSARLNVLSLDSQDKDGMVATLFMGVVDDVAGSIRLVHVLAP